MQTGKVSTEDQYELVPTKDSQKIIVIKKEV